MTDALRAEFEAWWDSETRPLDEHDCSPYKAAWAGYRAGVARVGIAREPTPKMIGAALKEWNKGDYHWSWASIWLAMYDAAREQPPQHDKAAGDTGGTATDGQTDAERA